MEGDWRGVPRDFMQGVSKQLHVKHRQKKLATTSTFGPYPLINDHCFSNSLQDYHKKAPEEEI